MGVHLQACVSHLPRGPRDTGRAFFGRGVAAWLSVVPFVLAAAGPANAQRIVRGFDPQKLANGIVGVMSYTVAPDVTTSSLSINNSGASNADLSMTQFGGGFTWSKETRLY